jgi:hypothetical protein
LLSVFSVLSCSSFFEASDRAVEQRRGSWELSGGDHT